MTNQQKYSDATQLASIRVAINSVDRNHGLSQAEREYHKRVLDCIADRIEDAMRRQRQAAAERRK